MSSGAPLSWWGIARLGLVQASIGAVVVLTTSTLNRVMVVELGLAALIPGALVALHYVVQLLRPRMGFGADVAGRSTPWILGGMAVLALGGLLAALGTAWAATERAYGLGLAVVAFMMIGVGVSASGTSLLALLAKRVAPERRAAAATLVWLMMIMGFAITAGTAGGLLDPYSPERLVAVSAGVSALACLLTAVAIFRLEPPRSGLAAGLSVAPVSGDTSGTSAQALGAPGRETKPRFREAFAQVWADADARRFSVFVFISMLAYSSQDLILEPFAGSVFAMTPGESTQLSGLQHGGVLAGMLLVAAAGSGWLGARAKSLRAWAVGGCIASALALALLVPAGLSGHVLQLKATVFALGVANGAFSIAAISTMMRLAGQGKSGREGVRMGLWGAAQALAFGLGGLVGTGASDLAHWVWASPQLAYAAVFLLEAALFLVSARLAWSLREHNQVPQPFPRTDSPRTGPGLPQPVAFEAR